MTDEQIQAIAIETELMGNSIVERRIAFARAILAASIPAKAARQDEKESGAQDRIDAERWEKLFNRMRNVAAGYSIFCDDSGSIRKLERDFEAIETDARAARKAK